MDLIRKNIGPLLIILAAAAIVVLATWPLESSQFAEGFRTPEVLEAGGEEGFEGGEALGGIALIIGPLIKVTLLMGIGVFFTWVGSLIGRFFSGRSKPLPEVTSST